MSKRRNFTGLGFVALIIVLVAVSFGLGSADRLTTPLGSTTTPQKTEEPSAARPDGVTGSTSSDQLTRFYTVTAGDTPESIAAGAGVPLEQRQSWIEELLRINGELATGKVLVLPPSGAPGSTAVVDVTPLPGVQLAIRASRDQVSCLQTSIITIEVRDAGGAPLQGLPVRVTSNIGSLNPSVTQTTDAEGTAVAFFTAPAQEGGTATITARSSGAEASTTVAIDCRPPAATPTPVATGTARTLTISASPASVSCSGTSDVRVSVTDADGAPQAGIVVDLSASLGSLGPTTRVTTGANGSAALTFSAPAQDGGSATITASAEGARAATTIAIDCTEPTPAGQDGDVSLMVSASRTALGCGETGIVTVHLRKADGSPVGPGTRVTVTADSGTLSPTAVPSTDESGAAFVFFTAPSDGGGTATITAAAEGARDSTDIALECSPDPSPTPPVEDITLVMTASPETLSCLETGTIAIEVRDADGPVGAGFPVSVSSDDGAISPSSDLATDADGTVSVFFTALAGQSDTATITAAAGDAEATVEVEIDCSEPSPTPTATATTTIAVSAAPASIACPQTSVVSVQVRDPEGSIVVGAPVTVTADFGSESPAFEQKTDASGSVFVIFTAPPGEAGTATLTAVSGNARGSATVAFDCVSP